MFKQKIIIFILLNLLGFNIYSQDTKLDSLQNIFSEIDANSNPEEALNLLSLIYEHSNISQPLLAAEYIGRAIFICDSTLKDSTKTIEWKEKLAKIYLEQNKLDQAMRYYVEVKNFYATTKDSLKYAYSLYYLGNIYTALNVPEIASQEYNNAVKIFLNHNDKQGYVLVNIQSSKILYDNYEVPQAFDILFKTLNYLEEDSALNPYLYKALGELYADEYEVDSAFYFLDKAVEDFKSTEKYVFAADCYLELGRLYLEDENFDLAYDYLILSTDLYEKNYAIHKQAESKNLIGQLFFLQNNFNKAEKYLLEALDVAMNYEISPQKLIAYDYLAKIYSKQGKLKKSNEYLNYYIDELNNNFAKKTEQGYAEVILTFQNEEKQKEIELLEKEDALKSQQLKNKQQQIYGVISALVIMLAFALLLYYYMQKQKRVNKLLKEQNRQIILQKKEIESQAKILEKATRNVLKQKDEIQDKNKKITASINYASRIQKAMLASDRIFNKYFDDHFILYKPKETVSGDFYWISEIKGERPTLFKLQDDKPQKIIITAVDCTGHGVPGAFMSMLGDAFLNQIVNIQHIYEPHEILSAMHKAVRTTLQQEHSENNDGMDMALCVIDKKNKTLEYSGARNPLVFIQNGKMTRIQGDLMSVGGLQREKERKFTKHTIDITAKTSIYLYSDGYQDQFGGKFSRKYMAVPFRNLLFDNHEKTFENQRLELIKEFKNWKGKRHSQMDDITVLGFSL